MRKKWTEEHQKFLEKHARFGYDSIKKGLKRNFGEDWAYNTLHNKVSESMLEVGIQKDEVPLVWIALRKNRPDNPEARQGLVALAKADGVLRKTESHGQKLCVPQWWADQIIQRIEEEGDNFLDPPKKTNKFSQKLTRQQASRILQLKGRKTQKQIATEFKVSPYTIAAIHQGKIWKELHA